MRPLTKALDSPLAERPLLLNLYDSITIWEHLSDEEEDVRGEDDRKTPSAEGLLGRESRREL